ncbi:MAG TPA: cation:proton antiporter [Candidatus Nitrosopolaris rasttigaisensis]|jgi:K+:H+ antiporter|nr:cation:proton antiporter [Candidatus Nitrosopolaris rasttigaisensis]
MSFPLSCMVQQLSVPLLSFGGQLFSHGSTPSSSPDFLIQDFAVIMIVAAIMLVITHRLKQPMVIGYILAGMIIGPYTPPFSLIQNVNSLNTFAELGIIMLLFVIGTEFPIAKLRSIGRISIMVALPESIGTLLIVYFVAQTLGFSFFDSLFLALAMSITSTVVTVRILEELGMIKDKSTVLILGITIVEDIIAITTLGIFQSVAANSGQVSIPQVSFSIGIVAAFIGSILLLGSRYVPKIIDKIGKTEDYALILIVILGLAFGLSFAAKELGLSVATGAFLAGVLVAESKSANIARVITTPLRDMFAAIFFISIGALIDLSHIPSLIVPAMLLILTSFASKFLIISAILVRAKGYDGITALRTGLGMASARGELSLVVAKAGQDVGAISSSVFPILGVVTIVTTFITPYVIKFGSRIRISPSLTSSSDEKGSSPEKSKKRFRFGFRL